MWGAATSAHQVEGGNRWNDWWEYEQQGYVTNKQTSGEACGHYHLFREDFKLAKSLNLNAQRISIEWSRIFKEPGKVDQKEIEHYREVLAFLKDNNFTIFVTLHHFTNPLWFKELGSWEKKENIKYFLEFVEIVALELGALIDFWSTFNEPFAPYATVSFLTGEWPPRKRSKIAFYKVCKNLAKAHHEATKIIKSHNQSAKVGIVYNLQTFFPTYFFERPLRPLINYLRNWWFLDKVISSCDYLGINYYHPIRLFKVSGKKTDMGWEVNPAGFSDSLKRGWKRYKKPIYVTENGIANAADDMRTSYIQNHLIKLQKTISTGADIRGYFHWSLIDNFEWAEGFYRKFGLFDIDYKTQKRIKRPSADIYAKIAKDNYIDIN